MLKTNYRAVVAAVLVGAAFFSPLLCGMTCLEGRGGKSATAEVGPVGELAGEFVGSAVVGCVLTHVVLSIDLSGWADVLKDGNWLWVGAEVVELMEGALRGGGLWK